MTDPISSVVRFPPVQPAARSALATDTDEAPAPAAPPAIAPPPAPEPAPAKPPVALSVGRDPSGVFVYTLTDSASGKVIAVIPRSAVVAPASGGAAGLDIQA